MKRNVIGILAHVDAGKTTMSEAMLFKSGKIKNLGRVDHKDAYLDNFLIERQRGITIFSKQAIFDIDDLEINLLDTPGHMDFSAEMERTLSVLDYAILVISGPDGIQAHTQTLWDLLKRYHIPTFVWINKMDLTDKDVLSELNLHFKTGFVDFNNINYEQIAELDEDAISEYLETGSLKTETIQDLILKRKLFPCFKGSALKLQGVDKFLNGLKTYTKVRNYPNEFKAKVYKITHADDGVRLTWIKLTGGTLAPRDLIGEEKITQIRSYSGVKFSAVDKAEAGSVYALTGLNNTDAGQGLGAENDGDLPILEPVLSYRIIPPNGVDNFTAMQKLNLLAEEDPMLRIVWNSQLKQIEAQLMGEVQIDVLKELISERYNMDVEIDKGKIVYKETIAEPIIGMGHFEPLRHYAEVHLLMEPLEPGTGLIFTSACSTDDLDLNWQRLVLTNLAEKTHLGVLTGSPITDMKISLIAGRAHLKHTEGGDFRQATYRAVRQGLMSAQNILLEPYYDFTLDVPSEYIGRAISDCKAMSCSFEAPIDLGDTIELVGAGPVSELQLYLTDLLSYTKGRGHISCTFAGYFPCHNTAKVLEEIAYEADRDVENTADSVFCSHGAGVNVKWNKVPDFVHLDSGIEIKDDKLEVLHAPKVRSGNIDFDEKELEAIMQREFGEIKRPQIASVTVDFGGNYKKKQTTIKKEYLIVDGYNIIFAWESLKEEKIANARQKLIDMLINYRAYKDCEVCLVFDGYKVKDNLGTKEDDHGIHVVYTKEGESADAYIESLAHEIGKNYSVKVATSDGLIQLSALRAGLLRMSNRELEYEVNQAIKEIRRILEENAPEKTKFKDIVKLI
ncbi:MAG: TetM/TetW/TetO/TetS family tetracycline resistance ribosomal protection protein [Bacillota bacterium]|nr:TetM/TetW/TetO/TetS family tetracycline resistance ribosomal protection protein [Bacillota bacterium]